MKDGDSGGRSSDRQDTQAIKARVHPSPTLFQSGNPLVLPSGVALSRTTGRSVVGVERDLI